MEILLIILRNSLIDNGIFYLGRIICALEELEDKALEKILLLAKVLLILYLGNFERVHGNRFFLTVRDISSLKVMTDTLIAISSIHNYDICILLKILSHHGVHKETLAASRGTKDEEIGIVGIFNLTFFSCGVYRQWHSLSVSIVAFQG